MAQNDTAIARPCSCSWTRAACAKCAGTRAECKAPESARPSVEGMAVDVFATVRQLGYPIEVLTDYHQAMNRYALLLVE